MENFYITFIKGKKLNAAHFEILKEALGAAKYKKLLELVNPEFLKEQGIK